MAVVLPFTFSNGTVANASQINANFNALAGAALDPNLPVTFTNTVQFNNAATFRGDVSIASPNVSAIGGPWLIQNAAGANPANPWNLRFWQGSVEVLRMYTVSGGGMTVLNELDVNQIVWARDIEVYGTFIVQKATDPPHPQNVPGLMQLHPLAILDNATGALRSLGNMSQGFTGSWAGDNLTMVAINDNIGRGNPWLMLTRAMGTATAPTMPVAGVSLGSLVFSGYKPNWATTPWACLISGEATETWTATTAHGAKLAFYTTSNGGTALERAMVIENYGGLWVKGWSTFNDGIDVYATAAGWGIGLTVTGPPGGYNPRIQIVCHNEGLARQPMYEGYNSGGTAAAPALIGNGMTLVSVCGFGYRGGTGYPYAPYSEGGALDIITDTAWTSASCPTKFVVRTTRTGQTTLTESLAVHPDGSLTITGNTATKPGSTAWVNPSDPRLKVPSSVKPYEAGLEQLLLLNPIHYRYNGEGPLLGYQGEHVGFDADHVAKVMPSLYGSMEYKGESYGTVDSGELIYTLVNAVKQLAAELAELKGRMH